MVTSLIIGIRVFLRRAAPDFWIQSRISTTALPLDGGAQPLMGGFIVAILLLLKLELPLLGLALLALFAAAMVPLASCLLLSLHRSFFDS